VNDAVFSQKIMGDGIAIEPEESMLYAPVQGVISVVFPTKHVIGMKAENGADIIMHVGIDTVELKGKGFDVCVKQGDVVRQGQLLMKMDLQTIREDYAATVMITIENSDEYHLAFTEQERVRAGQELMRVERA